MTSAWAWSIVAVLIVSALSLSGMALLVLRPRALRSSILLLISFSVGALLGDTFLHLLPELAEDPGLTPGMSAIILAGLGAFFILEKILHWHHAHIATEDVIHPVAVTNLVGDAMHNFVDGAIIAGAFLASTPLGVTTTLAVALHEIPQEIGDLGILMHAGMTPRRALLFNLGSSLVSLLGAVITLLVAGAVEGVAPIMLAITAGGFVYIAGSDLIPELQRETRLRTSLIQLGGVALGVGIMAALLPLG